PPVEDQVPCRLSYSPQPDHGPERHRPTNPSQPVLAGTACEVLALYGPSLEQPSNQRPARARSSRAVEKRIVKQPAEVRLSDRAWAVAELAMFVLLGLTRVVLGLATAIAVAKGQVDGETAAVLSAAFLGLRAARR